MRGSSGLIHLWRSPSGRAGRRHLGSGRQLCRESCAKKVHRSGFWGTRDSTSKFWEGRMVFILWLIAVVLVISGIVTLVRGQVLFGILLIIVGLLVGPGGVSIFNK